MIDGVLFIFAKTHAPARFKCARAFHLQSYCDLQCDSELIKIMICVRQLFGLMSYESIIIFT